MIEISAQSSIHPSARIGEGVRIGPYAVVGENCSIGDGTVLGAHAVIEPYTTVGKDCLIASGAVIGGAPQDLKFKGEESYTVIGDRNVIREFATINRATGEGEFTRIGNDNLLMSYVHVAHNCVIGNEVVISSGSMLAGHVEIEDCAVIAGMTGVHQFVRVGAMAMVGAMTKLVQDLPPYLIADGTPSEVFGPNSVGLKRRGLLPAARQEIKRAYRILYRGSLNLSQAIEELRKLEQFPEIQHFIRFIENSPRGIVGLTKTRNAEEN